MSVIDYEHLTRRGQIRRMRQIAEHALPQYGIERVSLSLLDHAYNTTFAVTGPDNARYALHILRPVEDAPSESQSRARVESELWWLDRVRRDLDLPVPVAVRTPTGEGVVSVIVEGVAPPRLCTLLHWIDGRRVWPRLTPAHLDAVGGVTARLHNHSLHLSVPAWFDRPMVDGADGEIEADVIRLFAECVSLEAADVIRAVLTRVREAQRALGSTSDTFGLIHADIHQNNYLFTGRDLRLIDFGDCGWGHYLYDLAVTIHQMGDVPHRAELRAALLAGYRRFRDLSGAHEALIDRFVMLREVQDLTWFLKARDDPSYGMRAAQVGKGVVILGRLLGAGPRLDSSGAQKSH